MTKTMKQLYNIYTLRWNAPSTDYQGSATCPQSVSYTFIQTKTKTKKQLYNIYTLRWNDPQITRGRQRVHNQLAIYTFIQSLPNSALVHQLVSTTTYHSSVWSANAAHLRRYSDVVSWSRSYDFQSSRRVSCLWWFSVLLALYNFRCATSRTCRGRRDVSFCSRPMSRYRFGWSVLEEPFNRTCHPSTSLLVRTALLKVDQDAGGRLLLAIHVAST